ncbi:MAG: M3 family metallopeptidase [Acidobacteria bacterium]|jgi:oligopeptidase A|nr:M3 family metallopeptidase [Bryobacteraceae bacterium CoA2 C42]MCA2965355.1 M3 family metallopeptidase [Acidobacteriaceae bacterium]
MNPLLALPFGIPFDQIAADHVVPGIRELIGRAQTALDAVIDTPEPRTYANTLLALDQATEPLDVGLSVVRHLETVATTPELREAFNTIQPEASAFYSTIPLNAGLWRALREFAATPEAAGLTGIHRRNFTKTMDAFRRAGADLDEAGKKRSEAIDVELANLTTRYAENVLDSTNGFELYLTEESQLAGLPPSARAAARQSAESKGQAGWRFTLQQPSYVAALTYLDDRAVRETLYRAYATRASAGQFDNAALTARILELRQEKAKLLGFANFADLVLVERMAKSGAAARAFVDDLYEKTKPFFAVENEQLVAVAGQPLEAWDIPYWAEKQRAALYEFDEEQLRPYFALPRVMDGLFAICRRLFGIVVTATAALPVWDQEVKTYDIHDEATGHHLGSFYSDLYPRENKRGGAWMDSFLTGLPRGEGWDPHLGLICGNLTPPLDGQPALLTHRDVETIFHEFGHLLHHCLTRVPLRSMAGTNVAWDFVELPSQIMENWCWEREALDLFARHHETGAPIPEELFNKMKRARTFRAANAQMRQLSFGIVDLTLHTTYSAATDGDVVAYSRRLLAPFSPTPLPPEHAMINSFTHLFANPVGYAGGYYSYKWSEVLDADAFSRFRAEGVFSAEAGLDFRHQILGKGDSEDPAELYRNFMGRDPDPRALLVRSGLLS